MRNLALTAALFAALPLAAQQPPPPAPAPAGDQQPKLEAPGMAAPEPEAAKPKTAPPPVAKPKAATEENGRVVEEIIARVNNEIITKSEYDKSLASAEEDAKQECENHCTPQQLQEATEDRKKNALRDLIDQSLLVQRGKDMSISVETDVIKQLDQIRIGNKLPDMEALEKAVTSQGLNWEDFKNNIRNHLITQKVIGQEVGSHITIAESDSKKFYEEHKGEFIGPESVALAEIVVSTEGKKDSELPDLKKKAETALKRVNDGENFGEIAKRMSDGSTKDQGGYLGTYKRGELAKQIEDKVFSMKRNQLTDVLETKQGYLVLQVLEHYDEGQQAYEKVKDKIMNQLYEERMQPALRNYLKTLREQSYVVIKPAYVTAAGGGGNSEIQEVSATPEQTKDKKDKGSRKWYFPLKHSKPS
ncbi:MAG TPA: peptidylprolyl isomerase [Candidatus Dormibacteraeota bacterium]|jgi:peptidyl-prolyl cis-trans isomerase SurA|nr:peptidylprolyl isomerase [Candidatus Dormibacteraeota bacterium]